MRATTLGILAVLATASGVARADEPPATDAPAAANSRPATDPPTTPPPATDAPATPPATAPDATPTPAPPPPEPVAPAPVAPPKAIDPNDVQGAKVVKHDDDDHDDYYSRERGLGMFHESHLALGFLSGKAPAFMNGAPPAMLNQTTGATTGELAFEGVYLGIPSSYGHFHGIEFSTGMRSTPLDFWAQGGTAVSLFNLGHGGPGSVRLGGSFGCGFDLAHAYGYVRGRAAVVLVPSRIDAEASVQWVPASAGTGNYEETIWRASVWWRPSGPGHSKRAFEAYLEKFARTNDRADNKRELDGIGGGVGMTLW